MSKDLDGISIVAVFATIIGILSYLNIFLALALLIIPSSLMLAKGLSRHNNGAERGMTALSLVTLITSITAILLLLLAVDESSPELLKLSVFMGFTAALPMITISWIKVGRRREKILIISILLILIGSVLVLIQDDVYVGSNLLWEDATPTTETLFSTWPLTLILVFAPYTTLSLVGCILSATTLVLNLKDIRAGTSVNNQPASSLPQ